MLWVSLADGPDHGDTLKGDRPMRALNVGIQLVQQCLIELGRGEIVVLDHGGVKFGAVSLHYSIQI